MCRLASRGWASNRHGWLLVLLVLWGGIALQAQTAQELKDRRAQLLSDIKANTRKLNDTRKDKEAALEQVTILRDQIRKREELGRTLQQEIANMAANIDRTTEVITLLNGDVERLQTEYGHLLRAAYRARLQHSWLGFLLSSRNFNEAFRRWQYLRQYQRFRSRQARLVLATRQTLENKLEQLALRRQEKESLLQTEENQKLAIAREKAAQDKLLLTLGSNENKLLGEIKQQEVAKGKLDSAIENAIAAEIERVQRRERQNAANTSASATTPAATPASPSKASTSTPAVGGAFAGLKGRLPWPIAGNIVKRFGRQPHPTVKGVEITNNGIDISAATGSQTVKTVADGVVASIHFIPGFQNMVLVRHGNYYTVYSNLETVTVKSGDNLTAGQAIGQLGAQGELHFEVWQQKERLNPERWIAK